MEENFPWKIVYLATIFSLVILGIAYYLISPRESEYFTAEKTEKIAEFKNTRVEGRKEGKKVWEFFAEEGWASRDLETTYLLRITKGRIYKDGQLSVSDLSAPQAKAYRHSEVVEAFGPLRAYLDLEKFSDRPEPKSQWTRMAADYIKYDPATKSSEIRGKVRLLKKDTAIHADKIIVDHDKKTAKIPGGVRIERENGVMNADSLLYFGETERSEAAGDVRLNLREEDVRTFIKCGQAALYNDVEEDISLTGSLEVIQGKKMAVAPLGVYSKKENGLFLGGGVKAVLEKGNALLKPETIDQLQNPDAREILKEKTVVAARELFFSTRTGDAQASGSVEVTQKGRLARSDRAVYRDEDEILTLSGNVFMKKGDDWVKCESVLISIPKETFEAVGSVEAGFKL